MQTFAQVSLRRTMYVAALLLLSACGFHLRGEVPPVAPVLKVAHIRGVGKFTDLYLELKRNLERAGSEVMADPAIAKAILNITQENLTRRVLTVDAQGRASEYELTYIVTYDLRSSAGEVILPAQSVSLLRDYKFDPDNVLAKDTEEAALRKALVTAAVQQMLRRMDTQLKRANENKS